MTDELDPQTQEHIDDPADVTTDTDAVTCDGTDVDGPILDESATTETPESENADEQNDDAPAQDDAPVQDDAPQAADPIEVSSEEELDAVMDSMMDAVKAMKDAVADADIDAEEEEAAEAASTFVPGETPVADQGSTMPSFLQLEHPTIGADAVDPHAAGFSVVEGGTGISPRRRLPMRTLPTPLARPPRTPPPRAAIWGPLSRTLRTPWAPLSPRVPRPCAR